MTPKNASAENGSASLASDVVGEHAAEPPNDVWRPRRLGGAPPFKME